LRTPLSALRSHRFDVVIVGAGINGCSAAQHLVAAGYDVLLVDKGDLGGETTSRSGRVLHCGLQLLAPRTSVWEFVRQPSELLMRLRIARETAQDHAELCQTMGDSLQPMDTAVPIYRGAPYAGWQVDIGARLVSFFGKGHPIHYKRWKRHSQSPHPFVGVLRNKEDLESVIAFMDQRFDWPERMAIDSALNAEEMGAVVRNFTSVESLSLASDGIWHVELLDGLQPQEPVSVSTRIVLNLAGAWVDRVNSRIRTNRSVTPKITAVKGVYILVRLPPDYCGAGVAGMNRVGEPICCLPWSDLHYIGPTETKFDGDIDDVVPGEDDVQFLLDEIRHFLPGIAIAQSDVIMAWAGVRPITSAPGYPKGKRLPFNVLHDLSSEGLPGMLALSWGIVVNHRSTARRIVAAVGSKLEPSRDTRPILLERRRFPPSSSSRLQEDHPTTLDDLRFCVAHEYAQDLVGVLFRRTGIAWAGALSRTSVDRAVQTIGELLGWSSARISEEALRFARYMRRHHCFAIR
jgi:glycerol-3-phosphate dehydrogenase